MDCLNCLTNLFIIVREKLIQCGGEDLLIPALLKTAASVKKIVSSAATETLKQACAYMNESRVLLHLSMAMSEKNSPALRLRSIQGLRAFIAHKGKLDPTGLAILQKACADPDPEVRLEAAILVEDSLDSVTKDVLLDKLDVNARKQLWRTIERYQKSKELQPPEEKENTPVKVTVTPLKKGIFTPTRIALGTPPIRKLAPFIRKPSELSSVASSSEVLPLPITNPSASFDVVSTEDHKNVEQMEMELIEKEEEPKKNEDVMDMEIESEDEEITINVTTLTSTVFQVKEIETVRKASTSSTSTNMSITSTTNSTNASSSIYTTPVKSSPSVTSPRLTPKSTSKVPLRVRLGLATCSPYQQQLAALESTTPTKHVIPLSELLQMPTDGDVEYLQRLCRALEKSPPSSVDQNIQILSILTNLLQMPTSDSQLLLCARILGFIRNDQSVQTLEAMELIETKNRQIFTEIIGESILQSVPSHVLRDFVKSHSKMNHFRALCFQTALSDSMNVNPFIRECALILKVSLNDSVISTRQAVAMCFKSAAHALSGFVNVMECFSDFPLSNLERRLAETYCQIW